IGARQGGCRNSRIISPHARGWLTVSTIDAALVDRLYRCANGARWRTPKDRFAQALEASAARACPGQPPDSREVERHLNSLHLEDLALACACAAGDDQAWEHFVREHR